MKIQPTEVKRLSHEGIQISWSDGRVHTISSRVLRTNCPSATSKESRGEGLSHSKPLTAGAPKPSLLNVVSNTIEQELSLERVWAVGNYAIGMRWADGHDSGIYTYDFLYGLGEGDSDDVQEGKS